MRNIIRRVFLPPLVTTALVLAVAPLAGSDPAGQVEASQASQPAPVTRAVSIAEAESIVADDLRSTIGSDTERCWERPEDRRGRTPYTAIVKADGGFDVREVTAADAQALSQQGETWVLSWCAVR